MSDWEIALYQTYSLWDYCDTEYGDGYRAQKRAKTYIEGAFEAIRNDYSDVPDHTVTVLTPSSTPNAPQQAIRPDFTSKHPCYTGLGDINYDNLVQWFSDWTGCKDEVRGQHCTALLTNGSNDGGGLGQTAKDYNHAGASTGRFIGDLPSTYDRYGPEKPDTNNAHDAMGTLMHEIGHSLQSFNNDADSDGMHHDVGYYDSYYDSMTPMGITNGDNECSDPNGSSSYVELCWSECSVKHWDYNNDEDPNDP